MSKIYISCITGPLLLKDYNEITNKNSYANQIRLDEKSPFTVVIDNTGKEMVVRKSSICWLLSKDRYKLSSDWEYSKKTALIKPPSNATSDANLQRGVGVLCSQYTCDFDGLLTPARKVKHKFINIESYVGTIQSPTFTNNKLTISTKLLAKLVNM